LGVACTVPDLETEAKQLVQAADRALYQSKKEGRDRVTVSDRFDYGLLE
jgi:PleD family two-component response regulator